MNWDVILTIFVTILVAVPSFIILKRESATRIYYIGEDNINFYQKFLKDFKELQITFRDNSINQKFFLIRGLFVCKGKKDIISEDIIKPIKIQLEGNAIWHYSKIISTSHDLDISIIQEKNELRFNFPLMKDKDFVYFEALGEAENFTYTVSHRIANVEQVKAEDKEKYLRKQSLLLSSLLLVLMCVFMLFTVFGGISMSKFDLIPVFFDKNGEEIIQNDHITKSPAYDSVLNSAKKSYNKFSLFKSNKTRLYFINSNTNVLFKFKYSATIIFVILMALLLYPIYFVINQLLYFFRMKSIYKIVNREIEKRKKIDT